MKKQFRKHQEGQALIPVLIVMLTVLILGAGVLYLSIGGLLSSHYSQTGEKVLVASEGALENGFLRILRNPAYLGESLQVNGLPCTIVVSGQAPITMTAECVGEQAVRRVQAEVSFVQGEMLIDQYQEIE